MRLQSSTPPLPPHPRLGTLGIPEAGWRPTAKVAEIVRCLFQIEEGIRSIGDRGEERNDEESREGAAKS